MQAPEKRATPALTVSQALEQAYAHHCRGNLPEAERLYAAILEVEPGHADALHLLGVARKQQGRHGEALQLIGAALEQDPDYVEAHVNLGLTLCELDRHEDALASYRRALAIDPDYPEAHYNIGLALAGLHRREEAAGSYRKAIELKPDYIEAHHNLAMVLSALGRHEESIAALRRALALKPDYVKGHCLLGAVLMQVGRFAEAEASYRGALAIVPDLAAALVGLGEALRETGRLAEAEASERRALTLEDRPETHNSLGVTLQKLGRLADAEASLRRALAVEPAYADAHNNLGNVLQGEGRLAEAEASYRRALEIRPDHADAHNNLGIVLREQLSLTDAAASYRRALAIQPDHAEAHSNLGNVLLELGRPAEAEAAYRRALELKPDLPEAHGNLIFTLDLMGGLDTAQQQAERREWYLRHARQHAAAIGPHENTPDPERTLRIGYVSADFRRHSAYYAISAVVLRHDRSAFEAVCYSGVRREDDATDRIRRGVALWRSTVGMSDAALAEQIRRDRIDILVDLSGHSSGNRLLAFARKPAPIQVTAWGHATGTGLPTIDCFFADPILVPPAERALYAEEVVDLPCSLCYEPPAYLPAVGPLPALAGKPFTFGCVNRIEKISDLAIALWSRLLTLVPEAQLLIKGKGLDDGVLRQDLIRRLQDAGIGPGRLRLAGNSGHVEHLRAYNDVDLGLDPFPQSGGISTAEALWMGVPVVTLGGSTAPSRLTASILTGLGWQHWIARSGEDYVRIAAEAAADLDRLAEIRMQLRSRLAASDFGDAQRYTRAVESAYRRLWQRWCEERAAAKSSR